MNTSNSILQRTDGTATVTTFIKNVWRDFKREGTHDIGSLLYFLALIGLFLIVLGLSSIQV